MHSNYHSKIQNTLFYLEYFRMNYIISKINHIMRHKYSRDNFSLKSHAIPGSHLEKKYSSQNIKIKMR